MDGVVLDVMKGHSVVAWGTLTPRTAGLTTFAHGSTTPKGVQKTSIVGKPSMKLKMIISWVLPPDVAVGTLTSLLERQPQYPFANKVLTRRSPSRVCLTPLSQVFLSNEEEQFQPIATTSATGQDSHRFWVIRQPNLLHRFLPRSGPNPVGSFITSYMAYCWHSV